MYRRLNVWENDRMFGIHREVAYVLFYLSLSERFSSKNSSSQKSNSRAASIIHVSVKSSRITPSSIPQEKISVQKSREPTAVTIRSTRFFISIKIILSLSLFEEKHRQCSSKVLDDRNYPSRTSSLGHQQVSIV